MTSASVSAKSGRGVVKSWGDEEGGCVDSISNHHQFRGAGGNKKAKTFEDVIYGTKHFFVPSLHKWSPLWDADWVPINCPDDGCGGLFDLILPLGRGSKLTDVICARSPIHILEAHFWEENFHKGHFSGNKEWMERKQLPRRGRVRKGLVVRASSNFCFCSALTEGWN